MTTFDHIIVTVPYNGIYIYMAIGQNPGAE